MTRLLHLWTLPNTLLGLALAKGTRCVFWAGARGGVDFWLAPQSSVVWSWWRRRFGFQAITLGTVIVCAVWPTRELLEHERRHRRQALILGPFYLPAYLIGCVIGWLRGRWYRRNPMELDARGE